MNAFLGYGMFAIVIAGFVLGMKQDKKPTMFDGMVMCGLLIAGFVLGMKQDK